MVDLHEIVDKGAWKKDPNARKRQTEGLKNY